MRRRVLMVSVLTWGAVAVAEGDGGAQTAATADAGVTNAAAAEVTGARVPSDPTDVKAVVEKRAAGESAGLDLRFLLPVSAALDSSQYELSAFWTQQNFAFPEGAMATTGLRFQEKNGGLSKLLMGLATSLGLGAREVAASTGHLVKRTDLGGGWAMYERLNEDDMRTLEEDRRRATDQAFRANFGLDLQLVLPREGVSSASGFSTELTLMSVALNARRDVGFELGVLYARYGDQLPGGAQERVYENLGMPLRLVANWDFVQFMVQVVPNLFDEFGLFGGQSQQQYLDSLKTKSIVYHTDPLTVSLTLSPLRHVFVRGSAILQRKRWDMSGLGFGVEAGVRL